MIYALHGFLGLAADWDFLKTRFSSLEAENLWQNYSNQSLKTWAENKSVEFEARFQGSNEPRVLMGYSLGGRLAMHLLLARPKFWSAAILISANPGTASIDERKARQELDANWSHKFLKDDWQKLMSEWSRQSLFAVKNPLKDSILLPRSEKDFARKTLADAIENWSLSKQDDLAVRLMGVTAPVLWLAGEEDEKYCDLLCGFAQVSFSHDFQKISHAGHRAPWDNPREFSKILEDFLAENTRL